MKKLGLLFATALVVVHAAGAGQGQRPNRPVMADESLVKAEYRNVSYAAHERNVVDVWLAKSETPTPVVVFFHGGGFRGGDKSSLNSGMLNRLLSAGISVAAGNYRFTDTAPFPAQMQDAARAIQYLRSKAKEWNFDKERFGAFGGSAGADISLWLAFHEDLADADSTEAVARESTRLACAGATNGQSSYDVRVWREMFGPVAESHPAMMAFYGIEKKEDIEKPQVRKLMEQASAMTHLSSDDVPVFLEYYIPNEEVNEQTPEQTWVHHPRFGIALEKNMRELGIECALQYPEYKNHEYKNMADFFIKKLKSKAQ